MASFYAMRPGTVYVFWYERDKALKNWGIVLLVFEMPLNTK